jgi:hypothetical protein
LYKKFEFIYSYSFIKNFQTPEEASAHERKSSSYKNLLYIGLFAFLDPPDPDIKNRFYEYSSRMGSLERKFKVVDEGQEDLAPNSTLELQIKKFCCISKMRP